ncbi:MAG: DNA polymerase III, partial [Deltaproteobacteria bacterium]
MKETVGNRKVAEILFLVADYLEILDENPFRVRAYRKAADVVLAHPTPVASLDEKDLLSLPGIGKDMAGKIREIAETGRLSHLEELKKKVPAGLLEMKKIPGLGPKKVALFYRHLGVDSVEKLRDALVEGKAAGLPG